MASPTCLSEIGEAFVPRRSKGEVRSVNSSGRNTTFSCACIETSKNSRNVIGMPARILRRDATEGLL